VDFLKLPPQKWHDFFDGMTKVMRGKRVEIEVVGLDLGDQIEASSLPLNGITYEPREDVLYVYTEPATGDLDHAIAKPREVFVEMGPAGVSQVVVVDVEGHKQFIRLRSPLALPASADLS